MADRNITLTNDNSDNLFPVTKIENVTGVTINGTANPNSINIYTPISSGTAGQVLFSNGSGSAPTWQNLANQFSITEVTNQSGKLLCENKNAAPYTVDVRSITDWTNQQVPLISFKYITMGNLVTIIAYFTTGSGMSTYAWAEKKWHRIDLDSTKITGVISVTDGTRGYQEATGMAKKIWSTYWENGENKIYFALNSNPSSSYNTPTMLGDTGPVAFVIQGYKS